MHEDELEQRRNTIKKIINVQHFADKVVTEFGLPLICVKV